MSESQTVPLKISDKFKIKRDDLVRVVSACQERTFAEEINELEKLVGEVAIEEGLATDLKVGIPDTEDDYENRIYAFGHNHKPPIITKSPIISNSDIFELFWEALKDFTLRILLFFALISIPLEVGVKADHRKTAWVDGFAILVAVFVVATVTAVNDYQKERQFQKLNGVADARKQVTVWRAGKMHVIHQSEVLVGDLVQITEGMEIPADGYVVEAAELTADESAMTGETDPIKKNVLSYCIEKRNALIAEGGKESAGSHDISSPILMSGTRVLTGEGKFLVFVVGDYSCVGKINALLRGGEPEATPLQEKLEAIARDIGKMGFIAAFLVLGVLVIRFIVDRSMEGLWDHSKHWTDLLNYLMISITIVVVAIPEGLPLAVTLSLAYSVKKMLKDNNLVRKLQACETMGGANMICSDKTGTLTQNKMSFTSIWNQRIIDLDTYSEKVDLTQSVPADLNELFYQLFGCNTSASLRPVQKGSKTEIALLEYIERCGQDYEVLKEKYPVVRKYPFTSSRKRMSTFINSNGSEIMLCKGASELVLEACTQLHAFDGSIQPMNADLKAEIEKGIEEMAGKALRTLCCAYRNISGSEDFETKDEKGLFAIEKTGLTLFCVIGIKDILRQEVPQAVVQCRKAGIKVRMVTGDNKLTARAIALECGIIQPGDENSVVMEGTEFINQIGGVVCKLHRTKECDCPRDKGTAKQQGKQVRVDTIANPEVFDKIYPNLDVMARSRPEDKYALVLGLNERSHVVAVTGDGTNDAPALKKADVGFAMGIAGTEVAREAADIILLDDNFTSIVAAVMWGRNIYDSIRKFLQFQLTVNVVAVLLTFFGAAIIKQEIFTTVQLLWINMIMDSLASLALATESPTPVLLDRLPHNRSDYIISRKMFKHILGQSIVQFLIIIILVFAGEHFLPEYCDSNDTTIVDGKPFFHKKFNTKYKITGTPGDCTGIVHSGRIYMIRGTGEDYGVKIQEDFPSRHFTIVYNTFVWLQIFNFINSRKIFDELNVFKGILKNPLFLIIVGIIILLQFLLISFTGIAFHVYKKDGIGGLTVEQWFICIGLSFISLPVSIILRFFPDNFCPQIGNKEADPIHTGSRVLEMRKSGRRESMRRSVSQIEGYKSNSGKDVFHPIPQE